ncbi:4a-hydroxytetrahydrobiopterin dehydratase [Kribbella sandramycini]|nr:4a-hydroxytetrahydrobiopterin dehydratase [Kribbella sandramycini]
MLTVQEIQAAGLSDWSKLAQALHARFLASSFAAGVGFAQAAGKLAGAHELDVRVTATFVDVRLVTPGAVHRDADGAEQSWPSVTQLDVDVARQISALAAERGLRPDPTGIFQSELGLDTADADQIGPFWAALLTGDAANYRDGEVVDPTNCAPNLWFQQTTPHEAPRQRFHFDIWLPIALAPARIAAVLAAGGVVTDDTEPSFTVVADAQGNRACVCTIEGR